jgi:hypothetical protein
MGVFDNIYFQVDLITYMRIFVNTVQIFNGTAWSVGWGGSWWNNGTLFIVGFSPTAGWTPSTAYTFWADIDMDVGGGTKTRTIWTLTSEAGGGGGGEVLYTPIVIDPGYTPTIVTLPIFNPTATNPPIIASFAALPASLPFGGGLTNLSWTVTGANSLSIDQGVGDVTGLTNINVNPVTSTIYILTATNFDGTVTQFVNVPVAAAPILVTGFTMSSITTAPNRIIVTAPFDVSIDECDITNWSVTNVPGISAVTVERISVDGDEITIYTSEQTQGGLYTLNLPYRFILNDTGTQQCTTATMNFTGTGIGIKVHHIEVGSTWDYVDVTFDEDAYDVDALDHNNYLIAGITIYSVIKLVNKSYRLSTSRLDPNTPYTLVANVRDIHYNA